ncbi:hypothetical protein J3R30DRAFT_3291790, partial [Lentinula aciculospora]
IYYSTLAICTILYRTSYWHPLAAYPSPLACRLSKFYITFISQKERHHLYMYNLHQKYGDTLLELASSDLILHYRQLPTTLLGPN